MALLLAFLPHPGYLLIYAAVCVCVLAIDSTSSRNAGVGIRLDTRSRGLGIIGRAFSQDAVRPCIFHGFSNSDLRRLSS